MIPSLPALLVLLGSFMKSFENNTDDRLTMKEETHSTGSRNQPSGPTRYLTTPSKILGGPSWDLAEEESPPEGHLPTTRPSRNPGGQEGPPRNVQKVIPGQDMGGPLRK